MALEPCRECGESVSTRAESCPHCGASTSSTECWECGKEVDPNTAGACPHCGAPDPVSGKSFASQGRALKSYYRRQFEKFEENDGNFVPTWNWPAFLFGVFWYFYRGLWVKGLVLTAVTLLSGGVLMVFAWGYCGVAGNYDYYLLVEKGTQTYPTTA